MTRTYDRLPMQDDDGLKISFVTPGFEASRMGFISWERLYRECSEFNSEWETVTHFEVDEMGIHYGVRGL
jgi:hypothetical protein